MADKQRFPQIPSTVWWGVHAILNRTPSATLDERFLSVQLKVQPTAAKAYIAELISVGILAEDFKATPLAMKWRLADSYADAAREIVAKVYPQGLIDLSPPSNGDRQKAISWFMQEGLGQGAAGNKASTYLMIGSATPNEAPSKAASSEEIKASVAPRARPAGKPSAKKAAKSVDEGRIGGMPLNVNLQIHISADASSDQIESIFSAMRRYLHNQQDT